MNTTKEDGDVFASHRHADTRSLNNNNSSTNGEYASSDDLAQKLESEYLEKKEGAVTTAWI